MVNGTTPSTSKGSATPAEKGTTAQQVAKQ
jgi:hypothetical protein